MLNNIGLPGLLLIAVVVLVLFGRGKISSLMGEVGKGITAFKRGVSESGAEDDDKPQAREIAGPDASGDTGATTGVTTASGRHPTAEDAESRKG